MSTSNSYLDMNYFTPMGDGQSSTALEDQEIQCDIIDCIALAQNLNVDLLPLVWRDPVNRHSARTQQSIIGSGGTSQVLDQNFNLERHLAFKRPIIANSISGEHEESRSLRVVMNEISVLGHPFVRSHPNIVRLQGIFWDITTQNNTVLPVLALEKADHGDLRSYAQSRISKLSPQILAGIACAIHDMHVHGIVHGDIKPENVLVFEPEIREFISKVSDFGYSNSTNEDMFSKDNGKFRLPGSQPWVAPEWHNRGFVTDFTGAKKMDVYSIGMLFLWFLFYSGWKRPHINWKRFLHDIEVQPIVPDLLEKLSSSESMTTELHAFFTMALEPDPQKRPHDLCSIMPSSIIRLKMCEAATSISPAVLLNSKRVGITNNYSNSTLESTLVGFSLVESLGQLYYAPIKLRSCVRECLFNRVHESRSSPESALFNLALCHTLGFGTARDELTAEGLVNGEQWKDLKDLISRMKLRKINFGAPGGILEAFLKEGYPEMNDLLQYFLLDTGEKLEKEYRREIEDLQTVLGNRHELCCLLREQLAVILYTQSRYSEVVDIVHDLTITDTDHVGETDPVFLRRMDLIAKVYEDAKTPELATELRISLMNAWKLTLGDGHLTTLSYMLKLATNYQLRGQLDAAHKLRIEMDKLITSSPTGWEKRWTARRNESAVLFNGGDTREAINIRISLINSIESSYGKSHPRTLEYRTELASIYADQQMYKEAFELHSQTVTTAEEALARDDPLLAQIHACRKKIRQKIRQFRPYR